MHVSTVDHARRVVRVDMSGFLGPDEVAAFTRDERTAASLDCRSGEFGLPPIAQEAAATGRAPRRPNDLEPAVTSSCSAARAPVRDAR